MDPDDVDQDEVDDTIEEYKSVQTELLIAIEEDPQVAAVARRHLLSALAENTELPDAEEALMVARAVTSKPVSTGASGI